MGIKSLQGHVIDSCTKFSFNQSSHCSQIRGQFTLSIRVVNTVFSQNRGIRYSLGIPERIVCDGTHKTHLSAVLGLRHIILIIQLALRQALKKLITKKLHSHVGVGAIKQLRGTTANLHSQRFFGRILYKTWKSYIEISSHPACPFYHVLVRGCLPDICRSEM